MKNYKVTYALDSLDPNPTIKIFNCSYEAEDWIDQQVENAVSWQVEHSPHLIDEDELADLREIEFSNIKYEEI